MNLKNLAAKAAGLNKYKLALYAALFLSWTGGVYGYATYNCKIEHEQEKTKAAEVKTVEVIKEVEKRVPVVMFNEAESAKQKQEIATLKGKLNEALNNRQDNPSCDLSDAEFNGVQKLAEQTRK